MLLTQHRRSSRKRYAPKRYEDETFVSGAIDRYQRHYNGRFKEGHYIANKQDAENHFHCEINSVKNEQFYDWLAYGGKKDFAESLLEFTSIWRDLNMVLPGHLVENIGSYLKLREADKGAIMKDDEFIVADDVKEIVEKPMVCGYKKNIIEDSDEDSWDDDISDTDISDWCDSDTEEENM